MEWQRELQCRVAQRGVQQCEMHGDVVVAQRSKREHLLATGRASASEYVPSPTEWLVGSVFVPSVVGASGPGRCVACKTFQSYAIRFKRKPFLLRGSVEKCATRNVKFRMC